MAMTFGDALAAAQQYKRVRRSGWNGKGMWITWSPGTLDLPADKFWSPVNKAFAERNGGSATVDPYMTMKTAAGTIQMGWLASQADMLANDWEVVED